MAPRESGGFARWVLIGVAVLVNLILTILLVQQIAETRADVQALKGQLASRQDVAMLRPIRVSAILQKNCTTCHTDRRFAALLGQGVDGIDSVVRRMQTHPGAAIPEEERQRIDAALLLLGCTSCHGEGVLSQVALMPPEERLRFLRGKVRMPGSRFRPDQAGELYAAFETLAGDRR